LTGISRDVGDSFAHKFLSVIGNLFLAAVTVALGLALAKLIITPNYGWALTITGVSFYLMTICANPLLGFLIWVTTSPFSRFYFLDIKMGRGIPDLTLTRLCAAFITVFLAAQLASRQRKIPRINKVDLVMLVFCLGFAISTPMAVSGPKNALVNFVDGYGIPFLIYLFARMLVTDRRGLRAVTTALFIIAGYLSVVAIREQLTGQVLFWFRDANWYYQGGVRSLAGLLGNPAFFGAIISIGIPFTIRAIMNTEAPTKRALGGILLVTEVVAVYLTYNRGSWLAFLLSMVFMIALCPKLRRAAIPVILAVVVMLAASWPAISSTRVYKERIAAGIPVAYRLGVYQSAGQIIGNRYLLGLGLGRYHNEYLRVVMGIYGDSPWPAKMMPHNAFLYVFFASGLVAMVPFVLIFVFMAVDGYALWQRAKRGETWFEPELIVCFGAAWVVYMVQSMIIDLMSAFYPNMVFFLIMGLMYGIGDALPRKASEAGVPQQAEAEAA
jgi:O-antigen ligase